QQPLAQPGELALEIADQVSDGVALGLHVGVALGQSTQRRRNANGHRHCRQPSAHHSTVNLRRLLAPYRGGRYAMIRRVPKSSVPAAGRTRAALPAVALVAYGLAFAAAALGRSVPAYDDHPGQLYRLWHVVTLGPAPWTWNPAWWAGYPELQFYPPAFAYAGALLHWGSLGAVSV